MNQKPHVQKLLQMQNAFTDSNTDTSNFFQQKELFWSLSQPSETSLGRR